MALTEEEIIERRVDIEKRILEWFDSFSVFLHKLVEDILGMYERDEISQHDAYEMMTFQLLETYSTNDAVINQQLELYLREVYILGLESADLDTGISKEDVAILLLLLKSAKDYIYKAETHFLKLAGRVIDYREDLFSVGQMKHRFDMIVVSEGTRTLNAGIIVRTTGMGVRLIYVVTDDEKLCQICAPFDGRIFYPVDCWHLLPQHPFCRCRFKIVEPEDEIIDI